jgi:hypothetical protein
MIRRSETPADHDLNPLVEGGNIQRLTAQAAAFAPVGTVEMVLRICDAIW